jgi:hypothetical protein
MSENINFQQLSELKNFIKSLHNPGLIDVSLAPNDNTIYHIYNDGEVTHQKGSYAYRQRTEFVAVYAAENNINIPADVFPITFVGQHHRKYGYAIVSREHAFLILEKLKNFGK